MARIVGVMDGLRAGSMEHVERKLKPAPAVVLCKYCSGVLPKLKRRGYDAGLDEEFDGACRHCRHLFGFDDYSPIIGQLMDIGVTRFSPEESIERIEKLRADGWGMILVSASFGAGGSVVEIEPGDIMKISRAGFTAAASDATERCSRERSKERFSISVNVGPLPLVLWPHEIAAVSFLAIMDMKRAGEIQESFVAHEDECGYFKPSDELREQIYDLFGRMTGRPRS